MSRVKLRVWGDRACFTRPEMKVERVSYDVMTPSAARGILEAIYWKPEIQWVVENIQVINPIKFSSILRNEISSKISLSENRIRKMLEEDTVDEFYLDTTQDRQQRNMMYLRDVDYVISARIKIVGGEDNMGKHLDIFNRRVKRGQTFHHPYFGVREFPVNFSNETTEFDVHESLQGEKDMGWMLYDFDYSTDEPVFFRANMLDGNIDLKNEGLNGVK